MSDEADRELIERLARHDGEALAPLVRRHGPALRRLLSAIAGSDAAGDDALQETFLSVLRSAGSFGGATTVKAWLFTIGRNAALRERRGARLRPETGSPLLELGLAAGWGAQDPTARLEARSEARHLQAALARLPDEAVELLLLRDVEGLSGEEAAEVLSISLAAMKSRLHRARLELMAALRAAGEAP